MSIQKGLKGEKRIRFFLSSTTLNTQNFRQSIQILTNLSIIQNIEHLVSNQIIKIRKLYNKQKRLLDVRSSSN